MWASQWLHGHSPAQACPSELPGVRSSVGPLLGSAHPPPLTGLAPPPGTSPTVDALSTAAGDSGVPWSIRVQSGQPPPPEIGSKLTSPAP